uniref:Exportin-1 (Trinotate prediction) n=1 Tax=Henneguya salminicola TaxID=69463 RepID=A0A6G3MFP6_HENSL
MFESFGYIISACDDSTQAQRLIIGCLDDHLTNWNQFNSNASTNSSECNNLESIQRLCVFLKISTAMCRSAGSAFDILISKIFQQLINLYSILSTIISQKVTSFGPDASLYSDVKILKGFKRDALNMLSCFIANCHENLDSITSRYFLPIVEVIFSEYAASPPVTRESEVLVLAAACINTLKSRLNEHIVHIFRHLFDSTLLMINQDHQEYPEHRIAFFKLIEAITTHCFQSLSTMSVAEFDFVMQSLFYAISHTMPSVTNVGLTILVTIFKNLVDPSSYSNSSFVTHFYKTYYISILDRIFHLVTDAMHSSDLAEHSFILSHMFNLLESNKIAIPIFEITGQYTDNISFVKDHSISFLKQQHDHLTE